MTLTELIETLTALRDSTGCGNVPVYFFQESLSDGDIQAPIDHAAVLVERNAILLTE